MNDWLLVLKAQHNRKGLERAANPPIPLAFNYDAKFKQYCYLKWQIVEEIHAQQGLLFWLKDFEQKR